MKNICILGCSFTTGDETIDEYMIPNYWDLELRTGTSGYKNYKKDYIKLTNILYDKYKKKFGDMSFSEFKIKYENDCRKLSWVQRFKSLDNTTVHDFSETGAGIDYFQYLYNNTDNKNFKQNIIDDDLLIWQLTVEPRYFLTMKNSNLPILVTSLFNIKINFDNKTKQTDLEKWKQKILIDYYELLFDEERFLKEKENFLELIILKRLKNNKPTIILNMFRSNVNIQYLKYLEGPKVHFIGFDNLPIYNELIENKTIVEEKSICRFEHPTRKTQKQISKYIMKYIKNNLNIGL